MWFRNLRIFRFTKPFQRTVAELDAALQEAAFKPCGPQDEQSTGWVSPLGRHSDALVQASGAFWMMTLRIEERLLPAAVIKEQLEEQVLAIESSQARKVGRKERGDLKDHVVQNLLPQAFRRSKLLHGYIDSEQGLLIVDSASANAAEVFTTALRNAIGSLPVRPIVTAQPPALCFTGWLDNSRHAPTGCTLDDECELKDGGDGERVVKVKGLDLQGEEMQAHLARGMQAQRLALTWQDRLSFVCDEDLCLRRLRFGDVMRDKLDEQENDDPVAQFDASFTLMALEIRELLPPLLESLGGEDRSAVEES
jgi:recombination associated protein RdgC